MSGIPLVCPACGRPPSGGAEVCPEHGLYAVDPSAAARRERAPLLGHIFADRYVMIDLLGDGGMGTVYRGIDRRLDRAVAIKVLGAMAMLDEDDRARFEREAQALSRLHSEHTVTVFDYGVATRPALAGTAYIVLELVKGNDLFERIQTGPLSPAEASSVITDVGRSLDEAHKAGIIHRDIKPSNVLLTTTPDGRRIAKVIDFGVARMEDGRRTRTGVMMGTPHYMAPEQCSGGNGRHKVDHRTDLYALGVVLFEILTGAPPFDGQQPMHILFKQVNDPPPPLPGNARSKLRKQLEAAIHTAMAKDVEDRQPTVRAFTDEVAAAIAAFPDEAARPLVEGAPTEPSLADTMLPGSTLAPFSAPTTENFESMARPKWRLYGALLALAMVMGVILALMLQPDPVDEAAVPEKISLGSAQPAEPPPEPAEPGDPPPVAAEVVDAGAPDATAADPAAEGQPEVKPAEPVAKPANRRGRTSRTRRTRRKPEGKPTRPTPKHDPPPKKKPEATDNDNGGGLVEPVGLPMVEPVGLPPTKTKPE